RRPRAAPPAAAQRLTALAAADQPVTDHALLVLLGHFAQHLGLVALLEDVPLAQKQVTHAPQTKLIQFLVAILAGIQQLQDLNDGPAPLVHDPTVPHAWGQPAFAHYSGVSRTLAAADATTLQAVLDALAQVSRPCIDREVLALLRANAPLTVDIDLTGRLVSPTSTSYPEATFGWMDDAVAKGYQSALSSLSGGPTGRLLLGSQRYAGHTKSAECLQAAVGAVEAALQVRPRRRTELVQAHLDEVTTRLTSQQQRLAAAQEAQATAQWKREQHGLGVKRWDERLQQQRARLERRVERLSATVSRVAGQVAALEAEQADLTAWLAHLTADNAAAPSPVTIVMRLDAGFATDANLAWLIEMGYTVLTKVYSGHTTKRIQRSIPTTATWTTVGANAEAVAVGPQRIGDGRYAVEALQVRYHLPEGWRWTTLVWYAEAPAPAAAVWFQQYNGRQTVEAGIKENKAVFTLRRPLVRSAVGMQLQEAFGVFAANFVRWAAAWVAAQNEDVPAAVAQALREVKTLVRVVAQSRARVVVSAVGCALVFEAQSAFAGAVLVLRGQPVYQAVLPLFTVGELTLSGVT
ncbi:MAG TPA: hypothetical protein VLA19_15025, partial [Herpetosiphonaceae bacterium]|nr:hypothetical protein [Herpetosiphonaceae bacterium]